MVRREDGRMNAEEVKKELATAPWVSTALMIEVVRAFGGTIIMGDETSKQGGTHVTHVYWPNGQAVNIDFLRQPQNAMDYLVILGNHLSMFAEKTDAGVTMYGAKIATNYTTYARSLEGAIWLAALEAGIKPYRE
jgi:hypothetical protein